MCSGVDSESIFLVDPRKHGLDISDTHSYFATIIILCRQGRLDPKKTEASMRASRSSPTVDNAFIFGTISERREIE